MWFDGVRQPNTLYVASVSRGKDSTAMLRAINLLNFPLDAIVSVDVWFDDETPAELPPMVKFKDEWDAKVLEMFGVPVTRLCAETTEDKKPNHPFASPKLAGGGGNSVTPINSTQEKQKGNTLETITDSPKQQEQCHTANRSNKNLSTKLTYCDIFYRKLKHTKSQNVQVEREREREREYTDTQSETGTGVQATSRERQLRIPEQLPRWRVVVSVGTQETTSEINGYPNMGSRWCNSNLKGRWLDKNPFSSKPHERGAKINIVHYIGIAADETIRIERHMKDPKKVLPLVQIGWDEALCGLEAQYMGMLSPTYENGTRDGCWFCHNQGVAQLRMLRKDYPDLWEKLMRIDLDSPVTWHADGHTVHDFDRRFKAEDDGIIDPTKRFRWEYLEHKRE